MQQLLWYPMFQALIGELYILSLFYNLCVIPAASNMCPNVSLFLLVYLFSTIHVRCLLVNLHQTQHTSIPSLRLQ